MAAFLLRRFGAALVVLWLASILVFAGVRALPGDVSHVLVGEERNPAVIAEIRHRYALDRSLPEQYFIWIGDVVRADLGTSPLTRASVAGTVAERLPVTLELAFLSLLIGVAIGIPAGVIAATRRGTFSDHVSTAAALIGLAIPHFWLGLMLIYLFAVRLGWLPASGYVPFLEDPGANMRGMVLPAIVLGTGLSGILMRQMRSAMLESLSADYIRTARAKGLSEPVVVGVHAFRNSLVTVVTVIGLQLGALLSGAVITEQIFALPGLGRLTIESVYNRDYAVLQGAVLVVAFGYVAVSLAVDLVYSLLNPRVRI